MALQHRNILRKYWCYENFREGQEEIIESITSGHDTLVLMPTGGGKTITFQVPALIFEGLTVVITPLISLMKDQIDKLKSLGIPALSIDGGMSGREIDYTLDNCIYGEYKFLYVSPERVVTRLFRHRFSKMNVSMIVADEAHCISQWGYDFRPSYLNIGELRELQPEAVMVALTASATAIVTDDILKYLSLKEPNIFRHSFKRDNLSYLVRKVEDKQEHILKVLNNINGSGIIYCNRRADTEELSIWLKEEGISADFYHAGLSRQMRNARQEDWLRGVTRVIVATNAFGMGIDKPNVRFVVHLSPPSSIESYYQEAGRAGRDGEESFAVLLYDNKDELSSNSRLRSAFPSREQIGDIYEKLFDHYQIGLGGGKGEGYTFEIMDFCVKFRVHSSMVYNSIKLLQYIGYLSLSEEFLSKTRIMFTTKRDALYKVQLKYREIDNFVNIILRLYSGLFSGYVQIDEEYIARESGYGVEKIKEMLLTLSRQHLISYIPSRDSAIIHFMEERLPLSNLLIPLEIYEVRKKSAERRLEAMSVYTERDDKCRNRIICNYFDEDIDTECGKCDYCRNKKKINTN